MSIKLSSVAFDQLLVAKKIVNSRYIIIFTNGDIMHISDDYSECLTNAIEQENPDLFFDNWELTAFVNLEKQQILSDTGRCLESLYLYKPNKSAYKYLYPKYNIETSIIIILLDLYTIDKKNLKSELEIVYLDNFTFFEIIEEYQNFQPGIKCLFIDLYGIKCTRCKNTLNVDLTIFPHIKFTKCAKCRFLLKS
jgi:hypothetical protein